MLHVYYSNQQWILELCLDYHFQYCETYQSHKSPLCGPTYYKFLSLRYLATVHQTEQQK